MNIREYTPADLMRLEEIYNRQGFEYDFPELDDPIYPVKLVVENGSGRPDMALALRLTTEAYLLVDPAAGGPLEKWDKFQALHRAAERAAAELDLDDVHCWLPPTIAKRFGRRLERLGWQRNLWPCWSKGIVKADRGGSNGTGQ
jgi:hypothetical protein